MLVTGIKSRVVHAGEMSLAELVTESLENLAKESSCTIDELLPENSVLAISSKVMSLCENNVVPKSEISKHDLIIRESDLYYFPPKNPSGYEWHFAIKNGCLAPAAGIDESNAGGDFFVLWPEDPQKSANNVRAFLRQKFGYKNLGVIIIDSTCLPPLKYGTVGVFLAYSGFAAIEDLAGTPDLFGREFKFEQHGIASGLAASANLAMGEGTEQMPFAILSDVDFVNFVDHDPTTKELAQTFVLKEIYLYAPFLDAVEWQTGSGGYKKPKK
jgi:F420-0:gamma-glutamyl ligase